MWQMGQTLSVLLLVTVTLTAPEHLQLAVVTVVAVQAGRGVVGVHAPAVLVDWGWTLALGHPQDGRIKRLLSLLHLLGLRYSRGPRPAPGV